jgi:hypothetical protein
MHIGDWNACNHGTIHEPHISTVKRKQNIRGVPWHTYTFLHDFKSFENILCIKFNRHQKLVNLCTILQSNNLHKSSYMLSDQKYLDIPL